MKSKFVKKAKLGELDEKLDLENIDDFLRVLFLMSKRIL